MENLTVFLPVAVDERLRQSEAWGWLFPIAGLKFEHLPMAHVWPSGLSLSVELELGLGRDERDAVVMVVRLVGRDWCGLASFGVLAEEICLKAHHSHGRVGESREDFLWERHGSESAPHHFRVLHLHGGGIHLTCRR